MPHSQPGSPTLNLRISRSYPGKPRPHLEKKSTPQRETEQEGFYEALGFDRLNGASPDGYAMFFLDSQDALALLKTLHERGIISDEKPIDLEKAAAAETFGALAVRGRHRDRLLPFYPPEGYKPKRQNVLRVVQIAMDAVKALHADQQPLRTGGFSIRFRHRGKTDHLSLVKR